MLTPPEIATTSLDPAHDRKNYPVHDLNPERPRAMFDFVCRHRWHFATRLPGRLVSSKEVVDATENFCILRPINLVNASDPSLRGAK